MLGSLPGLAKIPAGQQELLLRILILFLIYILVLRFESVIHEFDPYFNFRSTKYLVSEGFYKFINWFDEMSWYPLGRIVGGTIYPGLMLTAAVVYWILNTFNISVQIRNVCVLLAPWFASNTTVATYLLTKEVAGTTAGLVAAGLIAIVPGYISRSVAGSYDNEGIAIFALIFTYFMWCRAVNTGSIFWAACTSLAYFYMVSAWGGYVFIINLIPLHVLVLLFTGRFSARIYIAYCTFYVIGTLLSMQITFVGFQPVQSSEHMAALGVFGLLQVYCAVNWVRSLLPAELFSRFFRLTLFIFVAVGVAAIVAGTYTGCVRSSFFFDLHALVFLFPAGLYFCFKRLTDANIFIILYAITSVYFAGVMVRLMLVLAPIACITSAIAIAGVAKAYMRWVHPDAKPKKGDATLPIPREVAYAVVLGLTVLLYFYTFHCTWVTSEAYSSPSIVLAARSTDGSRIIFDDFREAYYWLRMNTPPDARVMSWWDYGYQITAMANRTVLVDNNTWNNTHIAQVGTAMASTEEKAYGIMRKMDVDYVLVIFGGLTGYSSDDINKFLWMVRIGGTSDKTIKEEDYYTDKKEFRVDKEGSPVLLNCLMYKLCYYRFGEMFTEYGKPSGYDRARGAEIGNKDFELDFLEEAYTSEHWIVRIYKVLDLDNRG